MDVLAKALGQGPGLRTTQMAIASVDPGQARYTEVSAIPFFEDLLDRARRMPGAQSASLASAMPMFSSSFVAFAPEGYRPPDGQFGASVWSNSVDERYFETIGIAILEGRPFLRSDARAGAPVAIVNRVTAHQSRMTLLVTTGASSASLLGPVRDVVHETDASVPVYDVQTMETFYASRATTLARASPV